jgi:imidazolonepropionase-like amidohydrolase
VTLVLENARLIDCAGTGGLPGPDERGRVVEGASVVVEGTRIAEVLGPGRSAPRSAARVIDLGGAYLLPGLWDVHVHLEWPRLPGASVSALTVQYAANATDGLREAGVTGIRTAGTPDFIDVALRRVYDAGRLPGPRIVAAGWFLTTTAGHALATGFAKTCDGPNGFVRAIREQMEHGVDLVKLNLSGGIIGPWWDRHWHSFFLPEELEAAFTLCRQRGYPVMAHAANPETVKAALRHGAHTVEHGYIMDDECLALFRERGAWYIPTLGITHLTPSQATTPWEKRWVEQRNLPPEVHRRAEAAVEEHRGWFQKALRAGVRMALGSDLRPLRDSALLEMGLWVKDGATPWQTLVAATRLGAEVCGLGGDCGTVEAGKLADLIAVRDNPLADVDNLRALELVVKDGRLVADHRREP